MAWHQPHTQSILQQMYPRYTWSAVMPFFLAEKLWQVLKQLDELNSVQAHHATFKTR